MTGFARSEGAASGWSWAVEARSVNGRNLEVRFKGPVGLDALEKVSRDAAQVRFQRGQINVSVQARRTSEARRTRINADMLNRYLAFGAPLVATGTVTAPSLDGLLALPGVLEPADEDDDGSERAAAEAGMSASILEALDGLKAARQAEGATIEAVLGGFLQSIDSLAKAAEAEASQQPRLIKARFERRLAELLGDNVDPDRITQEAAAMAVKADVREEIDRLVSHIAAARALLGGAGGSGRRLDFLAQEFMREGNTLCSKSASAGLTALGLDLKATIDQFREQVQNVE